MSPMQMTAAAKLSYRDHCERASDALAIAFAISLPWSTSASAILIVLWLLAFLPTLRWPDLRANIVLPAAGIPLTFLVLLVLGMAWSDASLADQWGSIKSFLRLLVIPLLFIQFRRSSRGMWVLAAYVASCTVLLTLSWVIEIFFSPEVKPANPASVPVKDYIVQSSEFLLCAFALGHLSIGAWRDGRRGRSLAFVLLALVFLANIAFAATGRSAVVIFIALLPLLALQRFDWRGVVAVLVAGVALAGIAWMSSSYLRDRVLAILGEVREYQSQNEGTSSGTRLEFWKKSIRFIAAAPLSGHGTGSVRDLFVKAKVGDSGPPSYVTDNPHNQTFMVAIQLGLIGTVLLFALWMAHFMLFRGSGLLAWIGTGLVVHNVIACLFNSYLAEVTLGWTYVFGIGVLGGMMLQRTSAVSDSKVAPRGERR